MKLSHTKNILYSACCVECLRVCGRQEFCRIGLISVWLVKEIGTVSCVIQILLFELVAGTDSSGCASSVLTAVCAALLPQWN